MIWLLAGGVLGWIGYSYARFNEDRGLIVSIIIGGFGGLFGGNVIAPLVGAVAAVPGDFSLFAMAFAFASAAALLAISNVVSIRYGV